MTAGLIERTQDTLRNPRHRVLLGEVLRFAVVGLLGVVIDIGLFNVFRHEGIGPLSAKALSTSIATFVSYFLNRHWSFAHKARRGLARELPMFVLLSAVGLAIVEACLAISHYGLDLRSTLDDNISANVVGLVLGTAWRFWSFKRWVFTAQTHTDEVLAAAAV